MSLKVLQGSVMKFCHSPLPKMLSSAKTPWCSQDELQDKPTKVFGLPPNALLISTILWSISPLSFLRRVDGGSLSSVLILNLYRIIQKVDIIHLCLQMEMFLYQAKQKGKFVFKQALYWQAGRNTTSRPLGFEWNGIAVYSSFGIVTLNLFQASLGCLADAGEWLPFHQNLYNTEAMTPSSIQSSAYLLVLICALLFHPQVMNFSKLKYIRYLKAGSKSNS